MRISARNIVSLTLAGGLFGGLPALATSADASDQGHGYSPVHLRPALSSPPSNRPPTASEQALRRYGYLVPNPDAYTKAKHRLDMKSPDYTSSTGGSAAPATLANFAGVSSADSTPSDSTGAIGTDRYIELVNTRFGIYDRSNALVSKGNLSSLLGASSFDNVFDPQVIWDPGTRRFYYTADQITSSGENLLAIGFSKTATPNGPADFCKYTFSYGFTDFPDYPKLGDTKRFWVIGVNVFSPNTFTGSDIIAITKPAAGTTCPVASTLGVTSKTDIQTGNGATAFTPVPANQIDTSGTGWVVARAGSLPASFLTIYKITRNATTGAAIIGNGTDVAVPSYTLPANAPQSGASQVIDTSDTRNTQAVSAIDPGHGSQVGLWTQHTTLGGAGAEVRWYEIDPATATLFQRGKVTDASVYNFNGAISPDRKVAGRSKAFGANMVMNFNTSSSSIFPTIKVVSKVGTAPQSAPVTVRTSVGPHIDFACRGFGATCRWGDYAAATPDPAAAATRTSGVVYGTNQYTNDGRINPNSGNWLSRNFAFRP